MRPVFIHFKETALSKNNKFTLDFSDEEFVQEIDFLSKNEYYITSLNCKLKLKEYIYDKDEKIKKLSAKSRLLLEKDPVYQVDIDYLTLHSTWYVKRSDNTYHFKLWSDIIDQYSYKYKFWHTVEKKVEIVKSTCHVLILLEKVLVLKEKL